MLSWNEYLAYHYFVFFGILAITSVKCPLNPWCPEQCPWTSWTWSMKSVESLDNVHGFPYRNRPLKLHWNIYWKFRWNAVTFKFSEIHWNFSEIHWKMWSSLKFPQMWAKNYIKFQVIKNTYLNWSKNCKIKGYIHVHVNLNLFIIGTVLDITRISVGLKMIIISPRKLYPKSTVGILHTKKRNCGCQLRRRVEVGGGGGGPNK